MGERPRLDLGDNKSLSHSRRSTFRRCRRLYYYQNVMKLELKRTPAPLRMGSIYSDCLELGDPEEANRQYSELIANAMHDSEHYFAEQLLDELAVVRPMSETYLSTVALDGIEREVGFVGTEMGGYQDNGFFDGIGESGDKLLLVENKLKGRFGKGEEEALRTDEQLLSYILNACVKYDTTPERVEVRYEVAKKPALRQGKNETRDTFRTRVTNDILTNPTKYHIVVGGDRLGRNQSQLDEWLIGFTRMVDDLNAEEEYMASDRPELAWPLNRDACSQFGGCPMIGICGAKSTEEAALEIEKNFKIRGQA